MIQVGQLRVWRGDPRLKGAPGHSGGECFVVISRIPSVSLVSDVWRVLLSTGETSMFDREFLELESEAL